MKAIIIVIMVIQVALFMDGMHQLYSGNIHISFLELIVNVIVLNINANTLKYLYKNDN